MEPHGSRGGPLSVPTGNAPAQGAWRFWWRGWAIRRPSGLDPQAAAEALGRSVRGVGYLQRFEGEVFSGFVNPRLLFIEHRRGRWHADGAFNPVLLGRLRAPGPGEPEGTGCVLEGRYTFRASLKVAVMLGLLVAASLVAGPLAGTVSPRLPGGEPDREAAWLMAALALVASVALLATVRAAVGAARARIEAIESMLVAALPPPTQPTGANDPDGSAGERVPSPALASPAAAPADGSRFRPVPAAPGETDTRPASRAPEGARTRPLGGGTDDGR